MSNALLSDAVVPAVEVLPFGIELATDGHRNVVRLRGELDLAYAAPVRAALASVAGHEVEVDLSALTFLDAAGLSALLAARRAVTARGHRLRFCGAVPAVRRVFELTDLAAVLDD